VQGALIHGEILQSREESGAAAHLLRVVCAACPRWLAISSPTGLQCQRAPRAVGALG
jgi:hypothetical protein